MSVQLGFTPSAVFKDGVYAGGAKASFFLSGTTTPIAVYTTEALTSAHPVPLVADSYGIFPQAFTDGAQQLKVVITTSVDTAIATIDPVFLVAATPYQISDVDTFADLETLRGVGVGSYVRVTSIAGTYLVVATGGDLDYSGTGGLRFDVVPFVGVNISHYGAEDGGINDSSAFVLNMQSSLGYVTIPDGNFRCDSVEITTTLTFMPGGYFTIIAGQTVTVRSKVESPNQWIFRGDGDVLFGHNVTLGEASREVHASWFNAFPYPGLNPVDQSPFFQKASTAMGDARESVINVDIGNYTMKTEVDLTRGCWIKGDGTRRTVFLTDEVAVRIFASDSDAVKISDVQFELHGALERTVPWVYLSGPDCEVYNVDFQCGQRNITMAGIDARVDNVRATVGLDLTGTNSSAVEIVGGQTNRVSNVHLNTSTTLGLDQVVLLGGANQESGFAGAQVDNISHVCPSRSVTVSAQNGDIRRVNIANVTNLSSAGAAVDGAIKIETSGTSSISEVYLNGTSLGSHPASAVSVSQASSGSIENLSMDGVLATGSSGAGVSLTRTAGDIDGVRIGGTCNFSDRPAEVLENGTNISDVKIDPLVLRDTTPAYCYDLGNMGDDTFAVIDLRRSLFSGIVVVSTGADFWGMFSIRAASSPDVATITASGIEATNVPLNGTTGANGVLTISTQQGELYVENRTGSSKRVTVAVLSGLP